MNTTTFGTETRAYFPVSPKPVFVGDAAFQSQDDRAVVREDTGAVLGIQRGAYKLVSALRVLCRYRHKTRLNREAVVRRTLASPAFDRLAA